jgi:hypothetical protein
MTFVMPDNWTIHVVIIYILLVILYLLQDGVFLPTPKEIWCLFRWLGCKEKDDVQDNQVYHKVTRGREEEKSGVDSSRHYTH